MKKAMEKRVIYHAINNRLQQYYSLSDKEKYLRSVDFRDRATQ